MNGRDTLNEEDMEMPFTNIVSSPMNSSHAINIVHGKGKGDIFQDREFLAGL